MVSEYAKLAAKALVLPEEKLALWGRKGEEMGIGWDLKAKAEEEATVGDVMAALGRVVREEVQTVFNPQKQPGGPATASEHVAAEKDVVRHPSHYTAYPVEVIDIIRMVLDACPDISGFEAYCLGNEIKYRMRAGLKGDGKGNEDLAKALQYKRFREGDRCNSH